jgi:nicotinamide-nucleotide adenylyltransferase
MNPEEEIIACFKREDFPKFHTGKISSIIFPSTRKEAHEKKIPHIICRIYAFTESGKILVQKRSRNRKAHANLYTDSASGHIQYLKGMNYHLIEQEAWRELKEEMGAEVIYGRLLDFNLEEFRSGGCELAYNFLALIKEQYIFDPIETEKESGFKTLEEFQELLSAQEFVKITKQYWTHILKEDLAGNLIKEFQTSRNNNQVIQNQIRSEGNSSLIAAVVGRFQPFHKGHLLLIKEILKSSDIIKIGIGSSQYSNTAENPFTYDERKEMLVRTFKAERISEKEYFIYPIPDFHDMYKWTKELMHILGCFDIFYSNNEWIRELILKKGKKLGEMLKFNFKIYNASNIRNLLSQNKPVEELLPKEVEEFIIQINGNQRISEIYERNKQKISN